MSIINYPANFLDFNKKTSKDLSVIFEIQGVNDILTLGGAFGVVTYENASSHYYGEPGLVYGAAFELENTRPYMTLQSALTIGQRLEPEQGRSSISSMSCTFIDKDGYMTNLVSPGKVVDDVLGGKEVKIWLGGQDLTFPDDYFVVFKGVIAGIVIQGPNVTLQLTDANQKKRRQIFNSVPTKLNGSLGVNTGPTFVGVTNGSYFYYMTLIGTLYVDELKFWIRVEDEFMQYGYVRGLNDFSVIRNANNSPVGYSAQPIVAHPDGSDVVNYVQLGPVNAITMALRLMLSGWGNGAWISDIGVKNLGDTENILDPVTNVIYFNEDVIENYGLVVDDRIGISGSLYNDGPYVVSEIMDDYLGRPNRIVLINTNLTPENPTNGKISIKSQFDIYPEGVGIKLKPTEVDIATHVSIRDKYFLQSQYDFTVTMSEKQSGKEFIEKELFLPLGCYSLTRYGRLSMGFTRPPVLINDKLVVLNKDNVINPGNITTTRALNNRKFYNEIDYFYDYNNETGDFNAQVKSLDVDSLSIIDQDSSMSIESKGARASANAAQLAQDVSKTLLDRYSRAAVEIALDVNFGAASIIEAGDIVMVDDSDFSLKIPNFVTGTRGMGVALFEVIDRQLDIKTGVGKLKLLSGIFNSANDRYGTISPSSVLAAGSTTTVINLNSATEYRKWQGSIGLDIIIHDQSYSVSQKTKIVSFDPADTSKVTVSPPLALAPSVNEVLEIDFYPTDTNPTFNRYYKSIYVFIAPSVDVVAGYYPKGFQVAPADLSKFSVGCTVMVHDDLYANKSIELTVTEIVPAFNIVICDQDIGFIVTTGMKVEFIGFNDKLGAYRLF